MLKRLIDRARGALYAWCAPELFADNDRLSSRAAYLAARGDALEGALVQKHQQAAGAAATLMGLIGALVLREGVDRVVVSPDMMAAAHALPFPDLAEGDDGSVAIAIPAAEPAGGGA